MDARFSDDRPFACEKVSGLIRCTGHSEYGSNCAVTENILRTRRDAAASKKKRNWTSPIYTA